MPRAPSLTRLVPFLLILSFVQARAGADLEYVIVEFNAAARAPEVNLSPNSDENAIRKVLADDQKQAAMEQAYVQMKVKEWTARFSIAPSGIERLHTAGTSPFVIEASPAAVLGMRADATWDGKISVMQAHELLDFEINKLDSIFRTTDESLLGEYIGAHFKHEILFSLWRAANLPSALSRETDIYRNFAKKVSTMALAKLSRLEKFLRRRHQRYFSDLLSIDRTSKRILTGYIRIEALPESALYPTRSSFFESLEYFNELGHKILLARESESIRVVDRWIGLQTRALAFPRGGPEKLPSLARTLILLGHRSSDVRHRLTQELTKMILDHENRREVTVRGVENDRVLRMALSIALERETAERSQRKASGLLQLDGEKQLERRYEIAEGLLRHTFPAVKISLGDRVERPPQLLLDLVLEMIHLDYQAPNFGKDFSVYFYRLSALQIFGSVVVQAENAEFRSYVNSRVSGWFDRLRSTEQIRGIEPNIAVVEYNMKTVESRKLCEGLFRSSN